MRRLLLPFNPRILLRGSPSFSSSIQQPYPVSFSPVGFETGSLFFRNSSTKRKVKGLNRLDLKFEGEKSILVSQLNYPPHWGSWVPPSSLPPPPPSPPGFFFLSFVLFSLFLTAKFQRMLKKRMIFKLSGRKEGFFSS